MLAELTVTADKKRNSQKIVSTLYLVWTDCDFMYYHFQHYGVRMKIFVIDRKLESNYLDFLLLYIHFTAYMYCMSFIV